MTEARAILVGYFVVAVLMLRQGYARVVQDDRMESYDALALLVYAAFWPVSIVLTFLSIAKEED